MMRTLPLLLLMFVAGALLPACAPSLTVRHLDFSTPMAEVWLDGERVGAVAYGEELDVSFEPGQHRIKATRPGEAANIWSRDGGEWLVVLVEDAVLTLLPLPGAEGRP